MALAIPRAARAIALAVAGAPLVALGACSDVLGFQQGVVAQCFLNSDCTDGLVCRSNACTVQCNTNRDCTPPDVPSGGSCLDHVCGTATEASVPDASAEASDDTADGDVCSTECPMFGVCKGSTCDPALVIGLSTDGDDHVDLLTEQFIECIEIQIPSCGYITGVGISLHTPADSNAQFRFGIYGDGLDGHPGTRLGQTDEEPISGIHADLMAESAIPTGCGSTAQPSTPIWVCLASSSMDVDIELKAESSGPWAHGGTPTEVSDYLSSGFPEEVPTSNYSTEEEPLLYAWFAYSHDQ